jgi:hypothetical protein
MGPSQIGITNSRSIARPAARDQRRMIDPIRRRYKSAPDYFRRPRHLVPSNKGHIHVLAVRMDGDKDTGVPKRPKA